MLLKKKPSFLKKGHGTLASDYHGETEFSKKRSESTIYSQFKVETEFYKKLEDCKRDKKK